MPRNHRAKYRNVVTRDAAGNRFDSRRERRRWNELVTLEHAGKVSQLKRQVRITLLGADGQPIRFDRGRAAALVVDFTYFDLERGRMVYEDAKGLETPVSKLKRAIVRSMGIEVQLS